jgi:hypothetical protein
MTWVTHRTPRHRHTRCTCRQAGSTTPHHTNHRTHAPNGNVRLDSFHALARSSEEACRRAEFYVQRQQKTGAFIPHTKDDAVTVKEHQESGRWHFHANERVAFEDQKQPTGKVLEANCVRCLPRRQGRRRDCRSRRTPTPQHRWPGTPQPGAATYDSSEQHTASIGGEEEISTPAFRFGGQK